MASKTSIEWTEQSWNPTTGCTKVSPGCKYCYAEVFARRLQGSNAKGYENGFSVSLMPDRLDQPRRRKKPTVFFVNSMSDLCHEDIPDSYIDKVLSVIKDTPRHKYQILTKNAVRLPLYFKNNPVPENAWIGVSVENKAHGLPRVTELRNTPAKIRFLSIEPLLEDLGDINLDGIHWVIVGGESGPQARPMKEEWVINIQRQCEVQNVPFFFKQWGTYGADGIKRSKKKNGRILLGETWNAMP